MFDCHRSLSFFCVFSIYLMSICLCLSDGVDKGRKTNKASSSEEIEVGSKDIRSSKFVKHIERDSDDDKKRKGNKSQVNSKVRSGNKAARKKSQGYRSFHTKGKIKRNIK